MRYVLERKESHCARCIIGNHSYPLPTYRWKGIAASDDREALEEYGKKLKSEWRITDTHEAFENDNP